MYIKTMDLNTIISLQLKNISMGVWRQDTPVSSSDKASAEMTGLDRQIDAPAK